LNLDWFYTFPVLGDYYRIQWQIDGQVQRHLDLLRHRPELETPDRLLEFLLRNIIDRSSSKIASQERLSGVRDLPADSQCKLCYASPLSRQDKGSPPTENCDICGFCISHLVAFLCRFCEPAAKKLARDLQLWGQLSDPATYFSELFQIALGIASHPQVFFQSFNLQRLDSLEGYIHTRMRGIVRKAIAKMPSMSTFGLSNLGLAARSSPKEVNESLAHLAIAESQRCEFMVLHQCLQEVRQASNVGVNEFERQHFQQIAELYERRVISNPIFIPPIQPSPPTPLPSLGEGSRKFIEVKKVLETGFSMGSSESLTAVRVEELLREIGNAIRKYRDRSVSSIDKPCFDGENSATSCLWIDRLEDPGSTLDTSSLQIQEFDEYLERGVNELEKTLHQIPLLMHVCQLNENQIATELNCSQSTVNRRYWSILKTLMLYLQKQKYWQIQSLKQLLENLSAENIKQIKKIAKEILESHYQRVIDRFFQASIEELATSISMTEQPDEFRRSLVQQLTEKIQEYIALPLKPNGAASDKITWLVDSRLENWS
jgi:hypothetical protein